MDNIKFATPDIGPCEMGHMLNVVDSRWITNGPKVREFENQIAYLSLCDRAVAYDSCTGAMEMTLRALGIGPGDEVITTPYTYSATAEVIRNVGAKIVFVDLDDKPESFEMDYEKVSDAITEKTKAIMPVDIGGKMCDYKALKTAILDNVGKFTPANHIQKAIGRVAIVADAAHSFGASQGGRMSGQQADFTCFSFHVLKNITTGGEGGAVVWCDFDGVDNDELERELRLLGDHGQTSRDKSKGWEYDIALFGYNSIMTDIDAAMGIGQLERLNEIRRLRTNVTEQFDTLFQGNEIITPAIRHISPEYVSSMHLYPVMLPDRGPDDSFRNKVYFKMLEAGIPCNVHYKPLPMMTAYKNAGFDITDYPNTYKKFKNELTLPYHTELTWEQQTYIVEHLQKAVKEA